jgi:hypothetical protein
LGKLEAFSPDKLPLDLEGLFDPIQVTPFQPENFHLPHPSRDCQVKQGFHPATLGGYQQPADLTVIENHHFLHGLIWRDHCIGWIAVG